MCITGVIIFVLYNHPYAIFDCSIDSLYIAVIWCDSAHSTSVTTIKFRSDLYSRTPPIRASYGVPFVSYRKKNNSDISRAHCIDTGYEHDADGPMWPLCCVSQNNCFFLLPSRLIFPACKQAPLSGCLHNNCTGQTYPRYVGNDITCCMEAELNDPHFADAKYTLKRILEVIQNWFRWWFGAEQATSHFLNQQWHSSLTNNICVTMS